MKRLVIASLFASTLLASGFRADAGRSTWRQATEKELETLIPTRAPVEKERIETELRTAAGVTDGNGKFIAGVVIITAGYAAEGKYSHFFITQVPIKIADAVLQPGDYVFGTKRVGAETLEVRFYEASTGKHVALAKAKRENKSGPVRSFSITPPGTGNAVMQIGRFFFGYQLAE